MARTSPPPEIEKQTKGHLLTYVNSHTSQQRMALRAQLILDWEAGLSYAESAKKNEVSQHTIAKWRGRFKTDGLAGLHDKKRSGKPREITLAQRKKVVHLACSKPTESDGRQRRSQAEIAKEVGISQSMVSEILRGEHLQPHKTEY